MSAAPTRFEPSALVYAAPSPGKGMGVFARAPIAAGTVVERAPVLVCPDSEWEALNRTAVGSYYLSWGDSASGLSLPPLFHCNAPCFTHALFCVLMCLSHRQR